MFCILNEQRYIHPSRILQIYFHFLPFVCFEKQLEKETKHKIFPLLVNLTIWVSKIYPCIQKVN